MTLPALVDLYSGGRLELGVARGAFQYEFNRMASGVSQKRDAGDYLVVASNSTGNESTRPYTLTVFGADFVFFAPVAQIDQMPHRVTHTLPVIRPDRIDRLDRIGIHDHHRDLEIHQLMVNVLGNDRELNILLPRRHRFFVKEHHRVIVISVNPP